MTKVGDVWWRFYDGLESAGVDEFDNPLGPPRVRLYVRKFIVTKVTPKGVRLNDGGLVLNHWRRKYANPTKALARESFLARKEKQLSFLYTQSGHIRTAMELAKQEPV